MFAYQDASHALGSLGRKPQLHPCVFAHHIASERILDGLYVANLQVQNAFLPAMMRMIP